MIEQLENAIAVEEGYDLTDRLQRGRAAVAEQGDRALGRARARRSAAGPRDAHRRSCCRPSTAASRGAARYGRGDGGLKRSIDLRRASARSGTDLSRAVAWRPAGLPSVTPRDRRRGLRAGCRTRRARRRGAVGGDARDVVLGRRNRAICRERAELVSPTGRVTPSRRLRDVPAVVPGMGKFDHSSRLMLWGDG